MSFYGIQLQRVNGGTISGALSSTGGDVPLADRIVNLDDEIVDGGMIITQAGGLLTINSSGNYYISWFVTLQTGLGNTGPKFSLIEDHYKTTAPTQSTKHTEYPASTSMKTGELSGSAIVQIAEGEMCKLGIYNTGNSEATLSSIAAIKANITVHPYVVGTYSSSYGLVGLNLTLTDPTITTLAYNAPIIFNNFTSSSDKIFDYDDTTGMITLKAAGNYTFDWMVNIDGSEDASAISFSLKSEDQVLFTFDSSLLLQNSFSGFTFLTATSGQTIQLVNTSKLLPNTGSSLTLSNTTMKACLRILGHS